jgi:hypothetical protein
VKLTVSIERLRQVLAYDPEAGTLRWLETGKGRKSSGEAGTWQDRYMVVYVDKARLKFHRVAWALAYGKWPDGVIDHMNGNARDNRLCNLRDVSHAVNLENQRRARSDSTSGVLGVQPTPNGKWRASIRSGGVRIRGKSRPTAEEARDDYLALKRAMHVGCTI